MSDTMNIPEILAEFRQAFMSNYSLAITTQSGETAHVIPSRLEMGPNQIPEITFYPVNNYTTAYKLGINEVISAKADPVYIVPNDIQNNKGYWDSKFFAYEAPSQPVASLTKASGVANSTTSSSFTENTYYQSAPAVPKKVKVGKFNWFIPVISCLAAVAIGAVIILPAVFSTPEKDKASDDGYYPASSPSASPSEDDSGDIDYQKYITTKNESLLIKDTPKLTDYDHVKLRDPLYKSDEKQAGIMEEDKMPAGWDISSYDNSGSFPLPAKLNGYSTDKVFYTNGTCSLTSTQGILSKEKIKSLGSTDSEATKALMKELIPDAKLNDETAKFSIKGTQTQYVEAYEFTYKNLSGKNVDYALRVFTGNGTVLVVANDCGWKVSDLPDENFIIQILMFPDTPNKDEIQPEK